MTLVDARPRRDTVGISDRGASVRSVVEQLGPLLQADHERQAWQQAATLVRDLFAGDLAATIEFQGDDRATFQSTEGVASDLTDETFAVAPDSQAAYVRTSSRVCVSDDILVDSRFTAPMVLTRLGIRSSMSASFALGEGGRGILGVYARTTDHFDSADGDAIGVLGHVLGSVIDRLREQRELEVSAHTDALTGLDNRAAVLGDLGERIRNRQDVTALLIDLDGFKSVNDQHGHRTGDHVLQTIATRMERSVDAGDRLGRLGGDEFLVLLDGHAGTMRAEQLIGHIEEIIEIDSCTTSVSASIGISRSRPGDDAVTMLERADHMMYSAKAAGRGQVRADLPAGPALECASTPTARGINADLAMVDEAIAGLRVVVQPIVHAGTGAMFGVEALTRGPVDHLLEFPDVLFESATTFGRLGDLELASKRLAFDLDLPEDLPLFVNLEPTLLCDPTWLRRLTSAWLSSGSRRPVVAELTERSVMEHPGRLLGAVDACREVGWQIALDDVGSRSESLAALRWIEPDIVKLDMSLIRNKNSAHSAHVVAAVAAYRNDPRRRHVVVIAEGVETQADAEHSDVLGADLLQGYRYGRPGTIEALPALEGAHGDGESANNRATSHPEGRVGSKRDLLSMSRHIEASALSADCVILSTLQHVEHFTRRTQRQYRAMARRCGFVGVLGSEVSSVPAADVAGIHVADIAPDDPLSADWQVLVMSPTVSIGLLATELEPNLDGSGGDDMDRLFRYCLVSEPSDVEQAVRHLLRYF